MTQRDWERHDAAALGVFLNGDEHRARRDAARASRVDGRLVPGAVQRQPRGRRRSRCPARRFGARWTLELTRPTPDGRGRRLRARGGPRRASTSRRARCCVLRRACHAASCARPTGCSSGPTSTSRAARELVPYLRDLGVSHLYLSPSLAGARRARRTATTSSTRARSRATLGGEEALRALAAAREPAWGSCSTSSPTTWATDDANRYWADAELRREFFDVDPATGRYRRFFDIDELAGVRQEDPEVFEAMHRWCSSWSREGVVDGLRIDHPDGLADPAGYLRAAARRRRRARVGREDPRPRRAAARLAGGGDGRLRVRQRRRGAVRRPGRRGGADRAVRGARRRRARRSRELADEAKLEQAHDDVRARGRAAAAAAAEAPELAEALAALPIYRTYVEPRSGRVERRRPRGGRRGAGRRALRRALLLDERGPAEFVDALPADDAAGHGQGRRGHRVLPLRPAAGAQRGRRRPGALRRSASTTSTPATPSAPRASRASCSSRDARHQALGRRARAARRADRDGRGVGGRGALVARGQRAAARRTPGPTRAEELLVYQTLRRRLADRRRAAGALPREGAARGQGRTRTGSSRTTRTRRAVQALRRGAARPRAVPRRLRAVAARVARLGRAHRAGPDAAEAHGRPGVPDVYQGDELWALSLVDPDNRRPVDWAARRDALDALRGGAPPDARDRASCT